MKSANDGQKLQVINFIDKFEPNFKNTTYHRDLKMMRLKYIFKDISQLELKKDVNYLRSIKQIANGK